MPDVYNNQQNTTSTAMIHAHQMKMSVSTSGTSTDSNDALIQNINISYAQPVQVVREIGSKDFLYYAQPPQGQLSISRLVSSKKTILQLFPVDDSQYVIWTPPKDGKQSATIYLSDYETGKLKYTLKQCVITNLGININADAVFVQEQIVIMFCALEYATVENETVGGVAL